jgi:hypothetical protein
MSCGEPDARERARPVRRAGRGNGPAVTPAPRLVPTRRGDAEVAVAELALDDDQRHALARHLDGVGVPELVRREASPHAGLADDATQLRAGGGGRPRPPPPGPVVDAEQRSDRQLDAHVEPGRRLPQERAYLALKRITDRPDPNLVTGRAPPEGRHFGRLSLGQLPMVCGADHRCRRAGMTSRDSRSIDSSAVSTGIPLQNGRNRK